MRTTTQRDSLLCHHVNGRRCRMRAQHCWHACPAALALQAETAQLRKAGAQAAEEAGKVGA